VNGRKECSMCNNELPIGSFGNDVRYADGLASRCRSCQSEATKAYYRRNESYRERSKARAIATRRKHMSDPVKAEEIRTYKKRWDRIGKARKYGLTVEQVEAMKEAQGGACAICECRLVSQCIDHDHRTGSVRGLLCFSCNVGIGHLRDDPRILRAALAYLTTPRLVVVGKGQ
jgi:hypothetical protein